MSLFQGLELEERVGQLWHRWVGERPSWPRFPQAAVPLDAVRGPLAVYFRGLGGDRGVQVVPASAKTSSHRLTWRQRLGMEEERMLLASRDETSLALPDVIDHFPDPDLNRDLFFWLAAFLAQAEPAAAPPADPLAADLDRLDRAGRASAAVLAAFPGLAARHRRLAAALLDLRPRRGLTGAEAAIEARVVEMLGGAPAPASRHLAPGATAPREYKPFLPVPLWGEALNRADAATAAEEDAEPKPNGSGEEEQDSKRRKAERRTLDNADRKDPLALNRFEKILALADMVNVNRGADDNDEDEAKKASDDMEQLTLSRHARKAATRLKFDLDLPPGAMDCAALTGPLLYPEWDWRQGAYYPGHCAVHTALAAEEGEAWTPDRAAQRRIRQVKRQFEALRTRAQILRAQADGNELDTEAVVRARSDLIASGLGSDRVYMQRRPMDRDLAVTVLVDASLSTDAWIENRRVLDVEKEALAVFAHGLAACGDSFSVLSFTSRKRTWVKVDTIKDFDEPFGEPIMRRIGAVKPGFYTRIGAAIRHAAAQLEERPNRHRLLLVITDGKPNDVDHYEGRYGIEDTRKAVQETRAKGLTVFGVTIDRKAQAYFPHLFGSGSFAIVHHLAQLTAALPRLYRHLAA